MADLIPRRPLDRWAAPPGLGLVAGPPYGRYSFRAGEAAAMRAEAALGFALPQTACSSTGGGDRHALWLGPDEWLLLGPADDGFGADLAAAMGDLGHALVDVSSRQTALIVSGAQATDLIAAGCPLDLDLDAFPIGTCTRTCFGKAEIVLWRTGASAFHLEVWRSFAAYVCSVLKAAAVNPI
jgi:sarcosine oxidase subunit gamma